MDVLDAARRFVNGLTGTATVRGPGGVDAVSSMRQTAPGRYSAPVSLDEAGTHVVSIDLQSGDGRARYALVQGIYRGVAAEITRADADMDAIAALARAGGGSVLDGTTSPFDQPRGAGAVDLTGAMAQLALALLLAEMLLRRV